MVLDFKEEYHMHSILMVDDTKDWFDYMHAYTTQEKRSFLQNVSIYIGNNPDNHLIGNELCQAGLLNLED